VGLSRQQENIVASFRGLAKANPRARVRKVNSAEELMARLLEKHKLLSERIESVLMPNWGYIVGEHNAHRCHPQRIENGVLRVGCTHPVLVRELTFAKKIILRRLQSVCPSLKEIKFVNG
jgi:hypothetical protein